MRWVSARPTRPSTPAPASSPPRRPISTRPTTRRTRSGAGRERTVIILGSGPNRIGQGVEFDYCCVRAVMAFREMGYRTVMVNSNPETVSTDYDMSDTLYFEPLTLEDVLEIAPLEQPLGVVVQLGGQTPLKLARGLEAGRRSRSSARLPTPSTWPRTGAGSRPLARELGVAQPPSGTARFAGRGAGGGRADRLSRAGAAVLCAGRPGDADRLRRRAPARAISRGRCGWRRGIRC